MKTVVKYNPQSKSWQAINGEVSDFGPGSNGKHQALLTALHHDHPGLYRVASEVAAMNGNDPKLLERMLKAAQLLAKGHVYQTQWENVYKVHSQTDSSIYTVHFSGQPAAYSCTCQDFENGLQRQAGLSAHGGFDVDFNLAPVCKHILATHLAWLSQWPLQGEPIPFLGEPAY